MRWWIKMRSDLQVEPKMLILARELSKSKSFERWLGVAPADLTPAALSAVILGLLHSFWSRSREYGELDGDDLVMKGVTLRDVSSWVSVSDFAEALGHIGWAKERVGETLEVVLPNFAEWNVALTPAQRQARYRVRKQSDQDSNREAVTKTVTPASPKHPSAPSPRLEKKEEYIPSAAHSGDSTPAKGVRKPPAKKAVATNPDHQPAVVHFCDAWEAKYGRKYPFESRDAKSVQVILKAAGDLDAYRATVAAYLADDSQWNVDRGHTLAELQRAVAAYLPKNPVAARGRAPVDHRAATLGKSLEALQGDLADG